MALLGICATCHNWIGKVDSMICKDCIARNKRAGRVCSRKGCKTKLTAWNESKECYRHDRESRVKKLIPTAVVTY
jgi:predicted amidophosphoribosyltransferase